MPRHLLYTLILAPVAAAGLTLAVAFGLSGSTAPGAHGGFLAMSLAFMIGAVALWIMRRPPE